MPSLFLALFLSLLLGILIPLFIYCLTWLTNRLELYQQLLNSTTYYQNLDDLHSAIYTIASTLTDLNSYRQDIEQFKFTHRFDLQHRLSISTIGDSEQHNSQSDIQIQQNNNSYDNRQYKSLSDLYSNSSV